MADCCATGVTLTRLDPAKVHKPMLLRLRAPQAFTGLGFERLRQSIAHWAGNVQAIKVRPSEAGSYELVFGSLRLQACLELGLPVLSLIEDLDTIRAVQELDASNGDESVSLYERGCLYESALQAGLFPSRRRLADSLGRDLRVVTTACNMAQLPQRALGLLRDPRQLSASAAKRLAQAVTTDPAAFNERVDACTRRDRQSPTSTTGLSVKDWLQALAP